MDPSAPVEVGHIIIAAITTLGSVVTACISAYVLVRLGRQDKAISQTHDLVNGATQDMIDRVRAEAFAAGVESVSARHGS